MQPEKCDVVVRYDELNGKLVLLAVPSARLDALFQQPHAAWVGHVGHLRTLSHEDSEGLVGLRVLRELDRHSRSGLQLRDHEAFEHQELLAALAALEQRAHAGDAAAQVEAFRAFWNQALQQRSLPMLQQADGFLKLAVAQNFAPALALAAAWPKLQAEAQASIAKGAP